MSFFISDFFSFIAHRVINLYFRISLRIFIKIPNGHHCILRGPGETAIHEKTLKGLSHEIDFKNFDKKLYNLA
jgi:hypothetical protein